METIDDLTPPTQIPVVEELLNTIVELRLKPGDRLPAERTLAETLGASRSSIREALATLQTLGFVEIRSSSGTYLRPFGSELISQTLRWGMLLGEHETEHLHRIRESLEVLAVELAIPHYTGERLAELEKIQERTVGSRDDRFVFIEADMSFHRHIAETSGNQMLANLLSAVRSLLRVWVERSVLDPDDIHDACMEHQRLLDAIVARDTIGATSAMRVHMSTAAKRILSDNGSADQ